MDSGEVLEVVRCIIAEESGVMASRISDNDTLADLGFDSLEIINLQVCLEERLYVSFPSGEYDGIDISDTIAVVVEKTTRLLS